jgi:predicted DNA-binding protein (UPF0251 family)
MTWSSRLLPFPHNLAPSQCRYIEAVHEHNTLEAAAASLGISAATVANGLKKARWRAGVTTTGALLERYLATKGADA